MHDKSAGAPDSSAVRVALWRALHLEADSPPYVIEDRIGLELAAPDDSWRTRPDMDPEGTKLFRASIVARARFIEDLIVEQADRGLSQYVILGAGLDTFAQRRPEIASRIQIFEIDRPGPQAWKRQRLIDLGFGIPKWLHLVPVDFEAGGSWREQLITAGLDPEKPALVSSTGVTMYLTKEAIAAMLREVAGLAAGSTLAMTYFIPPELATAEERPARQGAEQGARASGTPFISFFTPPEMQALARKAGFRQARRVPASTLADRYFASRNDGLKMPS